MVGLGVDQLIFITKDPMVPVVVDPPLPVPEPVPLPELFGSVLEHETKKIRTEKRAIGTFFICLILKGAISPLFNSNWCLTS
jgi:hypothetical protein